MLNGQRYISVSNFTRYTSRNGNNEFDGIYEFRRVKFGDSDSRSPFLSRTPSERQFQAQSEYQQSRMTGPPNLSDDRIQELNAIVKNAGYDVTPIQAASQSLPVVRESAKPARYLGKVHLRSAIQEQSALSKPHSEDAAAPKFCSSGRLVEHSIATAQLCVP